MLAATAGSQHAGRQAQNKHPGHGKRLRKLQSESSPWSSGLFPAQHKMQVGVGATSLGTRPPRAHVPHVAVAFWWCGVSLGLQ